MFKLGQCAEQSRRNLRGFDCLAKAITGVTIKAGIQTTNPGQITARSPHDQQLSNTGFDTNSEESEAKVSRSSSSGLAARSVAPE
jgi:hypothetical protein